MVLPPASKLRLVRTEWEDRAAALALAQEVGDPQWARLARVFKFDERTSVLLGEAKVLGVRRRVVVKVMRADRFKDRLARWTTGTRLMHQWDGGTGLKHKGILTPDCYAMWRGEGDIECLAMEYIEGQTLLHELARARLRIRSQHSLAAETGKLVAQILKVGAYNRDHKPSNIMVRWIDDTPILSVIDPTGLRIAKAGGDTLMLAKLVIECLGIGMKPKRTLMMRALCAWSNEMGRSKTERKKMWRVIEFVVQRHGDPTPKVDPLAEPIERE